MTDVGKQAGGGLASIPRSAAIFGASGGIGAAITRSLCSEGCKTVFAGSRVGEYDQDGRAIPFVFDLRDEASIADAAASMRADPPQWVIVASGVLTLETGAGPERTYKRLDSATMAQVLAINTIGPALIAKHMLPLMPRDKPFVFASLSARVGSISDNRLGGWHSYRASKAALNMLIKNFAIEMGRTHPQGVVVGLHPGTVDTQLSAPFHKGLPKGQLNKSSEAADRLIRVLSSLGPEESGNVFDFAGKHIPA